MKKPRALKGISGLSKEAQEKVFCLLEKYTYERAQEVLAEPEEEGGVGVRISIKSLRNYWARCSGALLVADRASSAKRAKGWLEYAASGDAAHFDDAAVEVMKQRSFELAESMKDEGEVAQLEILFGILCQVRLAKVRERTVAVREGNLQMRVRESEVRESKMQMEIQALRGRIRKEEREEAKELGRMEGKEGDSGCGDEEEDPVARVIQHCGSVAHFFKRMLPGERVMEAVERLDKEIEAGRLPWRPWDDEDEPLTENGRTGVFEMSAEDEEWVRRMKAERERKAGSEPEGPPACATPEEERTGGGAGENGSGADLETTIGVGGEGI